MKKTLLSAAALLAVAISANAVIAYPDPITVRQPDGTAITIQMHGDEYLHWVTCGNSLVEKGPDGYWQYASFDRGGIRPNGTRVRRTSPGGGSSVTPPASLVAKALEKRKANAPVKASRVISTGEKRFLILLIEFSDKKFSLPRSNFEQMLSGESYTYNDATGSVKRYYGDVSFGKFNPVFDVYGPIPVSGTSAEYASDDVNAVIEACQYAHDSLGVDFRDYCITNSSLVDNVFYFFPGYNQAEGGGSDCIWPHAVTYSEAFLQLDSVGIYHYGCASEFSGSDGETMAGIGTFCHEFGHVIGLPDFYDVDYSANGKGSALRTLSLMSSGNYNNDGRTPPYLTYEEKKILGWDAGLTPLTKGFNTLDKTSANKAYYTPSRYGEGQTPGDEYYLYESRPAEGWDTYTHAPGLAIYHIDKSDNVLPDGYTAAQHWDWKYKINAFGDHQCMDLVETVSPESEIIYYQQLTFPGIDNVTSLSTTSWDGYPTGYDIRDINFDQSAGTTSLTLDIPVRIIGSVLDNSGTPLPYTDITVTRNEGEPEVSQVISPKGRRCALRRPKMASTTGSVWKIMTDANGGFTLEVGDSGTYTVTATREGYVPAIETVTITGQHIMDIYMLKPAEGAEDLLLKYTDGEVMYSFGFGPHVDSYGAIRFKPEELSGYAGADLKSIGTFFYNAGQDTVDCAGVKVYFDSVCVCDKVVDNPSLGGFNIVDISGYGLTVPEDRTVTFVFYMLNPSFGYPFILTNAGKGVEGGCLLNYTDNLDWFEFSSYNLVMYATFINGSTVIDLAGFNFIPHKRSYAAGETFELKLAQSSVNPPKTVSWTVNGAEASGTVTLETGSYTVRAHLTYDSGRTETIEAHFVVE